MRIRPGFLFTRHLATCIVVVPIVAAASCNQPGATTGDSGAAPSVAQQQRTPEASRPSDRRPTEADEGQWVRPAKDYASTRYSTLTDINKSNVTTLKVAWTFSTGFDRGHEAPPLIVKDITC